MAKHIDPEKFNRILEEINNRALKEELRKNFPDDVYAAKLGLIFDIVFGDRIENMENSMAKNFERIHKNFKRLFDHLGIDDTDDEKDKNDDKDDTDSDNSDHKDPTT